MMSWGTRVSGKKNWDIALTRMTPDIRLEYQVKGRRSSFASTSARTSYFLAAQQPFFAAQHAFFLAGAFLAAQQAFFAAQQPFLAAQHPFFAAQHPFFAPQHPFLAAQAFAAVAGFAAR